MVDVYVHRWKQVGDDGPAVGTVRSVTRVDGVRVPISPIQRVPEQRQSERMWQLHGVGHHLPPVTAVQVGTVDVAVLAVSPIEPAGLVVNRQTVRPEDPCRDDDLTCWWVSVHASSLYLGNFTPVSPEHQPIHTQTGATQSENKLDTTFLHNSEAVTKLGFFSLGLKHRDHFYSLSQSLALSHTVSFTLTSYHTWQFVFTIFTITTFIFSHSFILSFWI